MRSADDVRKEFTGVPLKSDQISLINKYAKNFMALAIDIQKYVPDCGQREVALQKLLECKQAVVQSVTHNKLRERDTDAS